MSESIRKRADEVTPEWRNHNVTLFKRYSLAVEEIKRLTDELDDATKALKALTNYLHPDPYTGVQYKLTCPECGGLSWTTPRNHDDGRACPCTTCDSTGLHPELKKLRDGS